MKKTASILLTAGIVLGSSACLLATPALAQDVSEVSLSANVAIVSDYRFRGVSLSDEDPAIQGGIDASLGSFYVGTWASSIEQFNGAEAEVDLYGGWSSEFADGYAFDIGFLYYAYPDGTDTNYYEFYTSLGGSFDLFDWTIGAAYAPDSSNLDEDNIYVYGDGNFTIPDSPFYVGAHLGWEDGAFGNNKIDWSGSLGVTYEQWDVSVSYVDSDASDAGIVLSVGASF